MTPALWASLGWLLFVFACVGAAGVLCGYLIHWTLEWWDARAEERGTMPR